MPAKDIIHEIVKEVLQKNGWEVTDDKAAHYQFLWMGWKDNKHVFSVSLHMNVSGEKIWIQRDTTEEGIANRLSEKGIPKSDIVLAYFSPDHRKLTDFAVA